MMLSRGFQDALQYLGGVKKYSAATLANYERTGNQFIAYLRGRGLDDAVKQFTSNNVQDFCTYLGGLGAQANTILNKLHGLSAMGRFLAKRKDGRGNMMLESNPTKGVERPETVETETKFLYPAELAQFLAAECPPWIAMAREVFLDTGIRLSEACEANVGDVQEIEGTVYLTIAVKGRRQRGAQPASIPLSAACAERIKDSLLARGMPLAEEPLLVDGLGLRWRRTQLGNAITTLGRWAGITRLQTSPHKLRHTANVIARQAVGPKGEKIDPLTRSKMLNHRSMKTLARYDHLVPGETARGRELQRIGMEQYLQGVREKAVVDGPLTLREKRAVEAELERLRHQVVPHPPLGGI